MRRRERIINLCVLSLPAIPVSCHPFADQRRKDNSFIAASLASAASVNSQTTCRKSSSYSTAALEFEKEHQIAPVYESPRMSRRSLRLQTSAGHYGNKSLVDYSQNPSSYMSTRRETREVRSRRQQSASNSLSLSLSQADTPRKTLTFSAASTPVNSSFQGSNTVCDASQHTSVLDQSHLRQRTVTTTTTSSSSSVPVDGHWGRSSTTHHGSGVNGDASVSKSHTSLANGYICHDCSLHSQTMDSFITQSSSSSQGAEASTDALSSSSSPLTSIYSRDRSQRNKTAHSSFCGSMNVKDLVTEDESHLTFNGSLCDDCKGKQYSETRTVLLTQSPQPRGLVGALCSLLAYTGYCLLQPGYCVVRAGKALGSGVGTVAQKLLSLLWMLLAAPVKAGRGLLWFLAEGWYQLVSLMSLLNVFFLTRCLPKLWKLLLLLLPLLLLLALWLWGPSTAALIAYLPAINLTEWRPAASNLVPLPAPAPTPEDAVKQNPAIVVSEAPVTFSPVVGSSVDLQRLEHVERQLALLWQRVQQDDQKQEQRHVDVLGLYSSLREQLQTQTDRETLKPFVFTLLDQRLSVLRKELEQETTHRDQNLDQYKKEQESQAERLAALGSLLSVLAAKTERQQRYEHQEQEREKDSTAPVSVGLKQEDHDALLAEVHRLQVDLDKIKQDLQGVLGCKGKCEQLGALQETISAQVSSQVRKELQALFFGSGGSGEQQGEVPESLIHWLSQRYVSTSDLQASLASLESSILRNVSLQLELNQAQTLGEAESQAKAIVQTVTGTVQHTAAAEGLTEEQVKLIVQNALKLYSQDRTGLVDYALESGGGSILSTRCSETYETKTALMSLFGLPLWYFSQSPRVVIQPDVYPGNCWAFKGSQGYLVIRLSLRILPTSFCVEHIPKALSPTGNITSAPRNFTVFGLDDEYQEEGKMLAHFTYQEAGESLQTFPVTEQNDKAFQIIEVRVLSNWGHPEYTCLYRFRVHGEPRPQ
uniref:SUN domain-containing protein 1-like isoform X6 n=1 Tax=Monopterus albus TaxID=43700 RepID=UPI0009B341C4|nr:SUN domain-containing protein 1-like isoform X6 [Monopterus albus]